MFDSDAMEVVSGLLDVLGILDVKKLDRSAVILALTNVTERGVCENPHQLDALEKLIEFIQDAPDQTRNLEIKEAKKWLQEQVEATRKPHAFEGRVVWEHANDNYKSLGYAPKHDQPEITARIMVRDFQERLEADGEVWEVVSISVAFGHVQAILTNGVITLKYDQEVKK